MRIIEVLGLYCGPCYLVAVGLTVPQASTVRIIEVPGLYCGPCGIGVELMKFNVIVGSDC
jgi:hypothetical protein